MPDFCKRTKEILVKEMAGDTAHNRQELVKKMNKRFMECTETSEETKSKIMEHFDPLASIDAIFNDKFTPLINKLMDF